jgi:DNA-binding transcriptional MerR regulator
MGLKMISLNDLAKEFNGRGYKLTPRAIKYYVERGLLPKPMKQGGYREGVRLIYKDKEAILDRLQQVFLLKGRGFKLEEIAKILKRQGRGKVLKQRRAYLKRFKEANGHFYFTLENAPDGKRYKYGESLKEFFPDPDIKKDADDVERRGLFKTPYMYRNRAVYDLDMLIDAPYPWIELKQKYAIEWNILEALFKKHKENYCHFVHWPNPDGIRFSEAWVGYHRQWAHNFFGLHLIEYIKGIHVRFIDEWDKDYSFILDYKYRDLALFIEDFLSGNCAFVPEPYGGPEGYGYEPYGGPALFLRKFSLNEGLTNEERRQERPN